MTDTPEQVGWPLNTGVAADAAPATHEPNPQADSALRVGIGNASYISAGAIISPCQKYRYRLWREWRNYPLPAQWDMWAEDDGSPCVDGAGKQIGEPMTCLFVMLNPSTADGEQDDPTIRRCVGFAKSWGYDRMEVVNLFAYRATNPSELLALNHDDEPWGPDNQRQIHLAMDRSVNRIVLAWGAHGSHLGQDETVIGWIEDYAEFCEHPIEIVALGLTKDGQPRHPLYLPKDAAPIPFSTQTGGQDRG